jgi:cytochrome P450
MARLALEIVARCLFGSDVQPERAREIGGALTEALSQFGRVFSPFLRLTEHLPIPSTRRFRAARRTFDGIVFEMIEVRRGSGARGDDLLAYLMRVQDEGRTMTDEEIRDEVLTLFLAGHETTAVALAWTFWLLAREPAAEREVHRAVDAGDLATVDRAIAESIRLRPPAWAIGRRALAELEIGGHRIPRGSVLILSPWLLHHDPRWWPEPERFDLDRWTPAGEASRPRHAYLPFGGGPRRCIGEGFAWQEASIVIRTVAERWRLVPDGELDVRPRPSVTLRPDGPVRMRVEPRRSG